MHMIFEHTLIYICAFVHAYYMFIQFAFVVYYNWSVVSLILLLVILFKQIVHVCESHTCAHTHVHTCKGQ